MKKVGVLALQGSIQEHVNSLKSIPGVIPILVKKTDDLDLVERLIIPGGESTTIGKLLRDYKLLHPIAEKIEEGMPVWGTCAGMILLAKKIENSPVNHLNVMDITVRRNAYGSQLDSFVTQEMIPQISSRKIPLVFIRAPYIIKTRAGVTPLLELYGHIVAARQDNMLVTSFHPELTDNLEFHMYFCDNM